jgi:hypothetical protein
VQSRAATSAERVNSFAAQGCGVLAKSTLSIFATSAAVGCGRQFFAQQVSTAISRGCSLRTDERAKFPTRKTSRRRCDLELAKGQVDRSSRPTQFKEHRMMLEFTTRVPRPKHLAFVFLGAASFVGCGQDAASTPTASSDDATSAYQALSASLQTCQDDATSCETAAGSDATKLDACKSEAQSCRDKTKPQVAEAHKRLHGAADGCFKGAHHDDEDGGIDDGKGRHECMRQHVPPVPACFEKLFVCLIDNGFDRRQADVNAFTECVDTAHTCILDAIDQRMTHHDAGAGGASATAGSSAPVTAGAAAPGWPGTHGPGVAGSAAPGGPGSHGLGGAAGWPEPAAGAGAHDGKKQDGPPWNDGKGPEAGGPGHGHDFAGAGGHP